MIEDGKSAFHEETDRLLDCYGLLKMTDEQSEKVDREYLLYVRKEEYGYSALTNQKVFYLENYPEIIVEKGNIDEIMMMTIRGERV